MKCTESVNYSRVKVEENGKKAIFLNDARAEFEISQVDDCIVKSGTRCDKLVTKKGAVSILIELKGKDVAHACEQLFSSVEHVKVTPLLEKKIGFLVICSRSPRFDGFVVKAKQRAAKQFKAGFHIITKEGEFDIDRVAAIDGPF